MIDRNATDIFDFSTDLASQVINLTPGAASTINGLTGKLLIEANTVIEVLRAGRGNDALRGNTAANQIFADERNDTVEGGDGADTLDGGQGNDAPFGGAMNDGLTGGTAAIGSAAVLAVTACLGPRATTSFPAAPRTIC